MFDIVMLVAVVAVAYGIVAAILFFPGRRSGEARQVANIIQGEKGNRDFVFYFTWPVAKVVGWKDVLIVRAKDAREEKLAAERRLYQEKAEEEMGFAFEKIFGFPSFLFKDKKNWAVESVNLTLTGFAQRLHAAFKVQEGLRPGGMDWEVDDLVHFAKTTFWNAHMVALHYATQNMGKRYTDWLTQK